AEGVFLAKAGLPGLAHEPVEDARLDAGDVLLVELDEAAAGAAAEEGVRDVADDRGGTAAEAGIPEHAPGHTTEEGTGPGPRIRSTLPQPGTPPQVSVRVELGADGADEKTPLNVLQAGRTAGPEQRRGRNQTFLSVMRPKYKSSRKSGKIQDGRKCWE